MTRIRILTAIPLAALALSVTVAAAPADAARHGKHHQKHHTSQSRGHRTHKPKKSSAPAEVSPAEGAASEVAPDIGPAQPTGAVALIAKKGPADAPRLPELGPAVAAQIVDSGSTGDGEASDEDCEQFAEEIATAEWRQFVGEIYGSSDLATQGAEDAARLEDEGTDQGCFFVYE
jgi:hypothetical protein